MEDAKVFDLEFDDEEEFDLSLGEIHIVETGDYNKLTNKPSIEKHELVGDSTLRQIGVDTATVSEIEKILYLD